MDIVARLREFTAIDFFCSYFAKFSFGLGLGLLFSENGKHFGVFFMMLAIVVGLQAEIKFWTSHK